MFPRYGRRIDGFCLLSSFGLNRSIMNQKIRMIVWSRTKERRHRTTSEDYISLKTTVLKEMVVACDNCVFVEFSNLK